MKKYVLLACFALFLFTKSISQYIISEKKEQGSFPLISLLQSASLYIDDNDDWLVQKSATLLQGDIEKVTGKKSGVISELSPIVKNIVIIGTVDKSSIIKKLVAENKLIVSDIQNKWDAFKIQVVPNPFPGVSNALVIAGSNKRGAAYGVFELSRQMGVSPWYWWADVPVKKKTELYIKAGVSLLDSPKVKYRGIFINDEAPAFSGWTKEKFGGVNHLVYEKIFELILRLKGNYLWPAMWGNAFNDDDTLNPVLADKYGIVMGTSHHEPMLRAQQEWKRYGRGQWDYDSNQAVLKNFWRKGIQNMDSHESIVTIGMRGDGDKPMTEGTAISLLERIVKDQRSIIEEVTGKTASSIPQDWALYKEVQDYYDKGMRVPDDVTLLLCDDNWGNIRRLPKLTDKPRSGGYGIYYHFDYVGDPRNYKWLNTNQIERTWEQMHLAYEYGVNRIWIVNVGDIKPMEFPISFFLDYAWNPGKWNEDNLSTYYTAWAEEQFGKEHAKQIGEIIQKYTQYNARRKPELLSPETYSLINYKEAETVAKDYNALLVKAEKINNELPAEYKDAFFELVLHPVKACANLNELYVTVAWNRFFAPIREAGTNMYADSSKQLFVNDSLISIEYNKGTANGKWNHMMDQTHIGYTYWQQPPFNKMPEVDYVSEEPVHLLPNVSLRSIKDSKYLIQKTAKGNLFYEKDGVVSIEAQHFTKAINNNNITWKVIPGLGKTGSAITTFPVTAARQTPGPLSPCLQYKIYVYDSGSFNINAYFSPTLNFHNDEGLQYGIAVDDEAPQIISIDKEDTNKRVWEGWVADNIIIKTTKHTILKPGRHILKYYMVSPAVILQKIAIDFGGIKPSYLGPPETIMK